MPAFTAKLLSPQHITKVVDVNAYLGINSIKPLAYNYDVISGMIFNLLTTAIGEEVFEPEYGSHLGNRLFEPHDAITEQQMRTDIVLALERWIPFVKVDLSNTIIQGDPQTRSWDMQLAIVVPDFGNDVVNIQFTY